MTIPFPPHLVRVHQGLTLSSPPLSAPGAPHPFRSELILFFKARLSLFLFLVVSLSEGSFVGLLLPSGVVVEIFLSPDRQSSLARTDLSLFSSLLLPPGSPPRLLFLKEDKEFGLVFSDCPSSACVAPVRVHGSTVFFSFLFLEPSAVEYPGPENFFFSFPELAPAAILSYPPLCSSSFPSFRFGKLAPESPGSVMPPKE